MKEEATTLPQQFIKKYRLLLGEEASDFFSALEQGSVKKGFRWNPLKPAGLDMVQTYHSEELQPAPYSNEGFLGTVNGSLEQLLQQNPVKKFWICVRLPVVNQPN